MEFDNDLGQYFCEYEDLKFVWDDEPEDEVDELVSRLADNYKSHLDSIIEFMLEDLNEFYDEEFSINDVKKKLGQPVIDYENGSVTYTDQSFDGEHIFSFEFTDDEFEELQYFSIDG